MTREEVEGNKIKSDKLVESYGRFRLATSFEEAVDQLNAIWKLDPVEFQILYPKKCAMASSTLNKAMELATGSGKSLFGGAATKGTIAAAKTAGGIADKAAAAVEQANAAKKVITSASSTAFKAVMRKKLAAVGVGGAAAATSVAIGNTLKRELRRFNESCYTHYFERLDDKSPQPNT